MQVEQYKQLKQQVQCLPLPIDICNLITDYVTSEKDAIRNDANKEEVRKEIRIMFTYQVISDSETFDFLTLRKHCIYRYNKYSDELTLNRRYHVGRDFHQLREWRMNSNNLLKTLHRLNEMGQHQIGGNSKYNSKILKDMCSENKVKGYSKMTKIQLIQSLIKL